MGSKESVSDLLFISRSADKKYNGLALELKADGVKVWKKNGECYFPKQEEFLKKCREQGWRGEFAVGKDEAIKIIKEYFETK